MSDHYEIWPIDCREAMRCMAPDSVDSVVTDPPYELTSVVKRFGGPNAAPAQYGTDGAFQRASKGFMNCEWDGSGVAFDPATWREVYRVLKPGGHLLAFSGSRTYHRMVCAIEDAGFEIRDCIQWNYATGFPKSLNVSKQMRDPANAAKWQGWGTSLKPAFEPVVWARKPLPLETERAITLTNLWRLGARLWLISLVWDAGRFSSLNQVEYERALDIAEWTAADAIRTQVDMCGKMDTLSLRSEAATSSNTVMSCLNTLDESSKLTNTSTIATTLETTIDWKTLNFWTSQITLDSMLRARTGRDGNLISADIAVKFLDAEAKRLSSILELSALAPAMSRVAEASLDVDAAIRAEPIVVARKPLVGTVSENVQRYGTGAINIDASRVDMAGEVVVTGQGGDHFSIGSDAKTRGTTFMSHAQGRWPANVIHDGSDEVVAGFPSTKSGNRKAGDYEGMGYQGSGDWSMPAVNGDSGSAARFFYCAKASRADRNSGCDILTPAITNDGRTVAADNAYQRGKTERANTHPTVKPTDLMRYLVRLVTPPGGKVLDPFAGSGSTGKAAIAEGFYPVLCEMTDEYLPILQARIDHAVMQRYGAV